MRRVLIALALLAALALAPTALAADRSEELLRDACSDEHVDGTYTQDDYRKALDLLTADQDEYTGCRDVLRRARLDAARARSGDSGSDADSGAVDPGAGSGSGSPQGDSGSAPAPTGSDPLADATPQEREAVAAASRSGRAVDLGGLAVRPGLASANAELPTPVVAALALLGAGALLGGGWLISSRVLARRRG